MKKCCSETICPVGWWVLPQTVCPEPGKGTFTTIMGNKRFLLGRHGHAPHATPALRAERQPVSTWLPDALHTAGDHSGVSVAGIEVHRQPWNIELVTHLPRQLLLLLRRPHWPRPPSLQH